MMSSRMAATVALWELIKSAMEENGNKKIDTFLPYGRMRIKKISRSSYDKKLQRFTRYGLLKKKKIDRGYAFIITKKAKYLRSKAATKTPRNDGLATLIIFDIPQEKRNARDNLRRFLIRNGYTQLRESCFISPLKISEDLKEFIMELDIKKDVSILGSRVESYF